MGSTKKKLRLLSIKMISKSYLYRVAISKMLNCRLVISDKVLHYLCHKRKKAKLSMSLMYIAQVIWQILGIVHFN